MKNRQSGNTYQLKLGSFVGERVKINGPYDTWGTVIEIRKNGFNLIRGESK